MKNNKTVIAGGDSKPLFSLEELAETPFDIKRVLKQNASQNKPLCFNDAYALGVYSLYPYNNQLNDIFAQDKRLAEVQSIVTLSSLHNKATYAQEGAAEQIAGVCAAVFDYDIAPSHFGFVRPNVEYIIDNCGMGGDLLRTPNISTIAAIIAAREGINILKHGSPGNTDSTGSSDFLEYLGVDLFAGKEKVERGVEKANFGYTDAVDTRFKTIHVQTHKTAMLPHMNDIIGPITNPADPQLMKYRIAGINHLIVPGIVAETYKILNKKGVTNVQKGLFARGFADSERYRGMDEISTLVGGTTIAELRQNGEIECYDVYAEDFGLPTAQYSQIEPGKSKAEFGRRILLNKSNEAAKGIVLANTAAIFNVVRGTGFEEGVEIARNCLENKNSINVIEAYKSICRGVK